MIEEVVYTARMIGITPCECIQMTHLMYLAIARMLAKEDVRLFG